MLTDPKSFFRTSTARCVPSLVDLVRVADIAEFEALTPKSVGSKHKLRNFLIIPPDLLSEILGTDLTVPAVFLRVVQFILAKTLSQPPGTSTPPPSPVPATGVGGALVSYPPPVHLRFQTTRFWHPRILTTRSFGPYGA